MGTRATPRPRRRKALAVAEERLRIPELTGRTRMRRILIATLILFAAGGTYAFYASREQPVVERYRVEPAKRRDLVQQVEAAGRVDVRSRVEVPAPLAGRLMSIAAKPGDRVEQGQELGLLDPRAAVLAVQTAEAGAAAAGGGTAQARATLEASERAVERARTLLDRGLGSHEELAKAESELESARAALEAARAEQRAAAHNVASAKLTQSMTKIVAPVSGVVLRAPEHLGAAVGPEAGALFVIGESLELMRVEAKVSETEIPLVKRDQAAEVLVSALPGKTFRAQVERLSVEPQIEAGAVIYPVMLLVQNPEQLLLPGMTARVRMQVARADDALSVHEAALRFQPPDAPAAEPRSRVWRRVGPNTIEPVRVRTQVTDGAYVQVEPLASDSLKEGDDIVVGLARPEQAASSGPRVKLGESKK